MREKLRADLEIRENSNTPDELPQIRVSMDECGIAAGAKAVLATFVEELAARRIRGIVTQTGCAGHCKDEPTVEITLPGLKSVLVTAVMALAARGGYGLCCRVMPERLAVLPAVLAAAAVYAVLILAVGAVTRQDAAMLPKGEKLAEKLHLR